MKQGPGGKIYYGEDKRIHEMEEGKGGEVKEVWGNERK